MRNSAALEWSDALLTGVDEIDRQHSILVDTLIDAHAKLTDDAASPLFEQLTRDLLAYAIYHFATEERLMRQHAYEVAAPEAAATHLAQHRYFSQQVVALRYAARLGEPGSTSALLAFLDDWLVNHIQSTDRSLARFIGACSTAPRDEAAG